MILQLPTTNVQDEMASQAKLIHSVHRGEPDAESITRAQILPASLLGPLMPSTLLSDEFSPKGLLHP